MIDSLYDTLCKEETLYLAWQKVKLKNTSGGIDRKSVEDYSADAGKNITRLSKLLVSGKYIQDPYLETFIPKNEFEKRRLGLLTVNDKIVQTATSIILDPIFEKSYLNVSYAYRHKRGAVKAIRKVQHLISKEKFTWLASCDIHNFFDTIPHHILFKKLESFLKSPGIIELIRMFVMMGSVNRNFKWKDSTKGIPQGGVVSPMLANFYLYLLDRLMVDNHYGFVRYADDFIILGRSETDAQQALEKATSLLTVQLKLQLNEGSEVISVDKGFEFLGIFFNGNSLSLSERKFNRLKSKMLESSSIGEGLVTVKLKEVIRGISAFYVKLCPQDVLSSLDDELMAILRNKVGDKKGSQGSQDKMLNEFADVEFFAKEHNFKRIDYIISQMSLRVSKLKFRKSSNPLPSPSGISSSKAVLKRKHEYHKLESAGFDLIVNTPGTWIGKHQNNIIVKRNDQVIQEVPIINLKNITIQSEGIVFSSNVIAACSDNQISIDFLKQDGKPYAIIHQPEWSGATIGLAQLQGYLNGKGFQIICQIVKGKITNQINLIKYFGKYYKNRIPIYKAKMPDSIDTMKKYSSELSSLQHAELDDFRMKAFAMEGLSSSIYWETIGIIINTKVQFLKRDRQGATDLVNCMLNYGYGILYCKIIESVVSAGLNPNLSYLHKPEPNRPSLVYDLIEEFRQQAVDRPVISIIMKNTGLKCENGLLDDFTRKLLAKKVIERLNTIELFRNREIRLYEIIRCQAVSLAQYLNDKNRRYKPYIIKW